MKERIKDKINEIKKYLSELETIKPSTLEAYKKDLKTKAACERYVEKIAESIVDLAYLIIKHKNLKSPEVDTEAFTVLRDNEILADELANKLKEAKYMRNFIVHRYNKVDDEIVFNAVDHELKSDINEFIKAVEKSLK